MLQRNPEMPLIRTSPERPSAKAVTVVAKLALAPFRLLQHWLVLRRDQLALMRLSDEHLKDIGLSRSMIDHAIVTQNSRQKSDRDWITRR